MFAPATFPRRIGTLAASTLALICLIAIPGKAASIAITYSLAGDLTADPILDGNNLLLQSASTGSILSGNPALNSAWNPVTMTDSSSLDMTTGLLAGTFTMTFANAATLSGNIFEDDSATAPDGTGPFTQTLTFTAGTGPFAGATGSVSGNGVIGDVGFTVSGSGTLNTASVPEPASAALFMLGLAAIPVAFRRGNAPAAAKIEPPALRAATLDAPEPDAL